MLSPNDYMVMNLVKQKQAEHEERVRIARLLKETRVQRTGWGQRLLSGIGETFIRLGHWLKQSVEPQFEAPLSIYGSIPERAGD